MFENVTIAAVGRNKIDRINEQAPLLNVTEMSYVARPQVPPRGRFPGVCQVRAMPDLVWAPNLANVTLEIY